MPQELVGFRTPLLAHRPGVREQIAKEPGMLYDSSIPENYPSATSPDALNRAWPYTMDSGIPQDCAFYQATCTAEERYPGIFQVRACRLRGRRHPRLAGAAPRWQAPQLQEEGRRSTL